MLAFYIIINPEQIITALKNELKDNPSVYAFWLEGSAARNTMDEYSDLDLWFDVEDGKEDKVMDEIGKILLKFGLLDFSYQQEKLHPQIIHRIFHIAGTSEFLLLDANIQSHSREFVFTKNLPGEEIKIIFDKDGVIKFKDFDEKEFGKSQKNKAFHLEKMFAQQSRIKTLINRGEFIDAFKYYDKYILEPLTGLLKLKYAPNNPVFVKYGLKVLPPDVLKELEKLYKIHSIEDILSKIDSANMLFKRELT